MLPMLTMVLIAVPMPAASLVVDGAVIQKLIAGLDDSDPDVRQNLATALVKIGTASIAPLTKALAAENEDLRAGAAYALGLHGEAAGAALPHLLELIQDDSLDVRRQASYAISRLIPSANREGR